MSDFIERWSPNLDERALPISMIVLHYTGMKSGSEAIDWLANPESKVSAHENSIVVPAGSKDVNT